MSIIDEIIKEAGVYYKTTGNPPKKLYLDVESYAEFMNFAVNDDKDPLYFNSMEIIKIENWRIE